MITMPGVYMPQHVPTTPTTTTFDPVSMIVGSLLILPFLVWLGYLIYMTITEKPAKDNDKPWYIDEGPPPIWDAPSGGGKPIDLMRWFEPDNPYLQARIPREEVQVLEKERERVTV